MFKKLSGLVLLLTIVILVPTTVKAEGVSPWDEVWAAITDLQNQITNIQLTPGPQGPQGPQGIPGPAGAGMDKSQIYKRSSDFVTVEGLGHPGAQAFALCDDSNDVLLTGGFWTQHIDVQVLSSYSVRPSSDTPQRWQVFAIGNGAPGTFQAYADCLRVE